MPLIRSSRALLFRVSHSPAAPRPRTFTTTLPKLLKEDHKDPSGEKTERIKQDQVNKAEKGKGHWHEELASAGESNVKADQQEVKDHDEHMDELQQQGKKQAEKGNL